MRKLTKKLESFQLILASGSPRRKQLLEQLGLPFSVEVRQVDESFPEGLTPDEVAEYISRLKADAFREKDMGDRELVITADTVVTLDEHILGKPVDREDALRILNMLSGHTHQVITGVTIKSKTKQHTFSVSTDVVFKQLDQDEIAYYVDTFKPYDKAGAYGIQEWIGHAAIEKIEGSYFNVMGLPTHRLYEELLSFF
jgi:septum formation protein